MPDVEKIINGLEGITAYFRSSFDAMSGTYACEIYRGWAEAAEQALALLKAQEPCEDWISRKRLKDEIQYYIDEAGWGEEVNKALGWCLGVYRQSEGGEVGMTVKNDCPICGMKYNEPSVMSPFAPSMCWLETTLKVNGVIQMKFGYGDDFEHIFYYPKYCPECGRKVKADG